MPHPGGRSNVRRVRRFRRPPRARDRARPIARRRTTWGGVACEENGAERARPHRPRVAGARPLERGNGARVHPGPQVARPRGRLQPLDRRASTPRASARRAPRRVERRPRPAHLETRRRAAHRPRKKKQPSTLLFLGCLFLSPFLTRPPARRRKKPRAADRGASLLFFSPVPLIARASIVVRTAPVGPSRTRRRFLPRREGGLSAARRRQNAARGAVAKVRGGRPSGDESLASAFVAHSYSGARQRANENNKRNAVGDRFRR